MFELADMIEKKFKVHVLDPGKMSMKKIADKYGKKIFRMYNEAFAPLEGFTPMNGQQIESYMAIYARILDPRFVAICLNEDDDVVGFIICIPSISKAVKKSNGRLFPFGLVRILRSLRHNDTLEALLIGIDPKYQGTGAVILMMKYIHDNALRFGIKKMILNPELENNVKVQTLFEQYKTEPYMRRRAYRKDC